VPELKLNERLELKGAFLAGHAQDELHPIGQV
jgi:hypothetical protein